MHIDCVIVSNQYSDYLAQTLPINIPHFDNIVVVTTPEDKATQYVCSKYSVQCLTTHAFYSDGDKFNKANGINHGLAHLRQKHWTCHMDADIALTPNFKRFLSNSQLSTKAIYGMDRLNCLGMKKWLDYKNSNETMFNWNWLVCPAKDMPIGSRLAHWGGYNGYVPLGYFQLIHRDSGITRYPSAQGTAEHDDVLFSLNWDRPNRILIPELFCIHLETINKGTSDFGPNWNGRKTPTFSLAEEPFPVTEQFKPQITESSYNCPNYGITGK